jgi:hypothetical protein
MPKPNNFGTMGTVNTELSSDFTPPDIKKKKDADLPQIAGMCPGRPIGKPVETDVIPVINKCSVASRMKEKGLEQGNSIEIKGPPNEYDPDKPSTPEKRFGPPPKAAYDMASDLEKTPEGKYAEGMIEASRSRWGSAPAVNKAMSRIPSFTAADKPATPKNLTMKGDGETISAPHPDHNKLIGERAAKIYNSASPTELRTPGDKDRALNKAESEYWKDQESKGFVNLEVKGSDTHPGFKSVQSKIAEQYGGDMKKAGAILASRSRSASPAAKAKNPNLSKVKGEAKQKGFDGTVKKAVDDNADFAPSKSQVQKMEETPGQKALNKKLEEMRGEGRAAVANAPVQNVSSLPPPSGVPMDPKLFQSNILNNKGFDDVEEKSIVDRIGGAAIGAGGGALMGGSVGAVGGAIGADKGKRWEGAKVGAKRGVPIGAAVGAAQGGLVRGSVPGAVKRQLHGDPRSMQRVLGEGDKYNARLGNVAGAAVTGGAGYAGYRAGKNRSNELENKQLTKEFEMADRGNASYIEMKEFMNADFVEKGGTSPETLPNEKGGDEAEKDKLKDIMNKKQPPKGGLKTDAPDLTMDPEVQMVADKAEEDITSGYVGDTQGAKVGGKGFDAFNEMVSKGIVADVNINRYNVHDSVTKINEVADMELKGCAAPMGAATGKKKAPPWLKKG